MFRRFYPTQNYNIKNVCGGAFMASFGELLRELRDDHKMTQKELAEKICVTIGTISNYENDQHLLDIEKLIMLADYFDVTTDYLLGRAASPCSPDIFQQILAPGVTVASFLETFQKLSPDRQQALILIMNDMKFRLMLQDYHGDSLK